MRWLSLTWFNLLLMGCALGPIEVVHRDGELPKVRVALPVDECKLRVKYPREEYKIQCEWEL